MIFEISEKYSYVSNNILTNGRYDRCYHMLPMKPSRRTISTKLVLVTEHFIN